MYYTIYKISNKINDKVYIGSHKTKNLDDNYMGSGKYLKHAQEKHGMDNFEKEILFVFDTPELMYAKEAELVNEDFLTMENTYNLKIGGFGGWDYLNNWEGNPTHSTAHMTKMSNSVSLETKRNASKLGIQKFKEMYAANGNKAWWNSSSGFTGKLHSEETKKKIGNSVSKVQSGFKNSQFGTMWITNDTKNKKINKHAAIPTGWRRGRILRFDR